MDELDVGFRRAGRGWRNDRRGYRKHAYWTWARAVRRATGVWRAELAEAGTYRVEVRIPIWNATTRRATYGVKTADGWAKRVRNQRRLKGRWVSLGVFRLTANPIVTLTDRTGERGTLRRRVAYDAIRFVPVDDTASTATIAPSRARRAARPESAKPVIPVREGKRRPGPGRGASQVQRIDSD